MKRGKCFSSERNVLVGGCPEVSVKCSGSGQGMGAVVLQLMDLLPANTSLSPGTAD